VEQVISSSALLSPTWVISPNNELCKNVESALQGNATVRFEMAFQRWQTAVDHIRIAYQGITQVVIVDEEAGDSGGLNWLTILQESTSTLFVLVLVDKMSDTHLESMFEMGVSGCLAKPYSNGQINSAVLTVVNGGIALSPTILRRVMKISPKEGRGKNDYGLTRREKEVLRLLVDGKSVREIADNLLLSYHTADTHLKNLHRKFRVKNSRQIVSIVLRESMLD
jgi:DNA-binding NarL/FixJ family response regulator